MYNAVSYVAYLGLVTGCISLAISFASYRRDRARLAVTLHWDYDKAADTGKSVGIVVITNTGRRPAYVLAAAIRTPDSELRLASVALGSSLREGDPPFYAAFDQQQWLATGRNGGGLVP